MWARARREAAGRDKEFYFAIGFIITAINTNIRKLLKIKNWIRVWKHLNAKERIWLGIFFVIILFSISYLVGNFYRGQTKAVAALGGTYIEAVSESPHNLNPLLATNDSDRDFSRLIFSSLLKYNEKSELVPDLAASYEISKDRKTYTLKLKEGVLWHDGEPFNAEDVVFTIDAVQNPEYNSPLRTSWQGVKVETSDKNTIILTLKTPYGAFVENLALLGILPKHVWSKVIPQNFPLADFNLKPIGTGPYRFVKLQKDSLGRITSVNLTANPDYFSPPLIKNLVFKFYFSEEETVSAFNRKEVDGLFLQTAQNKNQVRGLDSSFVFSLRSLKTYALFFNTDDPILKDKNVRLAINYAVNREELLNKLLNSEGKIAVGPIPPGLPGSSPDITGYDFNPKKAGEILEKAGWARNENGIYAKKLNKKDKEATPLKFSIVTAKSLQLVAVLIRDYLKNVGIEADLKIVLPSELQQNYLRTKNYNAILFGESYTNSIDPYIYWHGTAIKDPGRNLSLYNNKKVNKILEDARQITDPVKRAQKLENFQKSVLSDAPAVFLYSPNYIYVVKNTTKNINLVNLAIPSSRFSKINEWYIETKRIWR